MGFWSESRRLVVVVAVVVVQSKEYKSEHKIIHSHYHQVLEWQFCLPPHPFVPFAILFSGTFWFNVEAAVLEM